MTGLIIFRPVRATDRSIIPNEREYISAIHRGQWIDAPPPGNEMMVSFSWSTEKVEARVFTDSDEAADVLRAAWKRGGYELGIGIERVEFQ